LSKIIDEMERNTESSNPVLPVTIYEPQLGKIPRINWRELWAYRELLYFLTWRDIKIRYKQAALGVAWAILQPVITMIIFSVIFGRLAKLPSEGIPYPVFSFVALLPWQLFSGALSRIGNSLVSDKNLLTKIYFPRLTIPLSAVGAALFDFAISFVILIGMMVFYGIKPTWALLTFPLFILLALVTAVAVGLWFAAVNVQYRDVQYALPFIIQAWMYASPVAYSTELIPQGIWRTLYGLNPMAGVIDGFRWALLGTQFPDLPLFLASILVMVILLITGLMYFKKMEEYFADLV
jgi:lipopolysaccharide transport system permease protein